MTRSGIGCNALLDLNTNEKEQSVETKNIAAFTEATNEPYPAYLSINRNADGSVITVTARERGHNGEKQVTLEIPEADLLQLGVGIMRYADPR